MHIRALRNWGWVAIVLLPMSAIAAPLTPLADRVPNSAIAYFGWAGTDALQPAYDKSHLKAMLDQTNLVDVVRDRWPQMQEILNRGKTPVDPVAAQSLWLAFRHPMCAFIDAVDLPEQSMPAERFGILVDAGSDEAEIVKAFNASKPKGEEKVQVGSLNHIVWFVSGVTTPFEPEHGGAASLEGNERLLNVGKHLGFTETPGLSMYVDLHQCLKLADRAAERDE